MEAYSYLIIIPLIVSITQVIKTAGVPKKFAPLISLVIGMVLCIFYESNVDIKQRVLDGIIAGLIASGSFSAFKSVAKSNKK
ncbi:hypothetical protein [Tepidibacter aestuarii]|uniref:hypothetical protein n=1 Tax=Tepidibacter aestuarii TaxID=2925782 RepID=UPI0020C011C3|nr:hypothetical protein [Tepidibacter aestuarii]CAH2214146.1 conserved protein of unknown function [Tepidibacter aestuarii]